MSNHLINDRKDLKGMITLFKAYNSLTEFIKEDIKNTSFDINEFGVFEIIYHKKKLSINEIKDKVLIANSSLSYILDKLENKDLINKEKCETDKRVTYISLSNKGLKKAEEIFPVHYDNLKQVFNTLTKEEEEMLITINKKIGLKAKELLK